MFALGGPAANSSPPPHAWIGRNRWVGALAIVAAVALAWRLAYLWRLSATPLWEQLSADAAEYWAWSGRLAGGDWIGLHPFFLGPLYPYLVGLIRLAGGGLPAVMLVQACFGAATAVLIADATRRATTPTIGLAIGLLFAAYGPAVFMDGLVLMESPMLLLGASLVWIAVRWAAHLPTKRSASAAGLIVGLMSAGRPSTLLLLAPVLVALVVRRRPREAWLAAALAAAVIAPITIRNAVVGHELIPVTYSAGYNFYVGNNAEATGSYTVPTETFSRGDNDEGVEGVAGDGRDYLEAATGRAITPAESSRMWRDHALQWMRTHPMQSAHLLWEKALMFWNRREYFQISSAPAYATVAGPLGWPLVGSFGVLGALGLAGLLAFGRTDRLGNFLRGYCLVLTGVAIAFFVTDRYRVHLVPALAVAAGCFIDRAWQSVNATPRWASLAVLAATLAIAMVVTRLPAPSYDPTRVRWDIATTLGDAYLSRGDATSAKAYYREALSIWSEGRLTGERSVDARVAGAALNENAAVANLLAGAPDSALPLLSHAMALAPDAASPRLRMAEALALRGDCGSLRLAVPEPDRQSVARYLLMQHPFWLRARPADAPAVVDGVLCLDPQNLEAWSLRVWGSTSPRDSALADAGRAGVSGDRHVVLTAFAHALDGRRDEAAAALSRLPPQTGDADVARLVQATVRLVRDGR